MTSLNASEDIAWGSMSYNKQYDLLFKSKIDSQTSIPKPDKQAQKDEPGAGKVFWSDLYSVSKRSGFNRVWTRTDISNAGFIASMHILACLAPFTFSWYMFLWFCMSYFVTGCLGITLSYHRQLSHRSFSTPKWLEYILAYCGVLACQGDPIEWVSSHRYHHLHTDTPLDPHSPFEGFWWSHILWIFDNEVTLKRVGTRSNAGDLESQYFYRWLQSTLALHAIGQFVILYLLGGLPLMIWAGAFRIVWVYHITWFVNSASHIWGYQTFISGDLSKNNWWVGILAFGEGWHNNHHAFKYSARHGLEWWEFDMTWVIICVLEMMGFASNITIPSKKQMNTMRISK